ncbi:MAG TPA: tetratricopeptide repeat protein [Planctomycetota bacterium]|nr:tetratricopeptide repeat protein [Planctomycetota bacterium]
MKLAALALAALALPQAADDAVRARVATWRELLELDLAAQVLEEGPAAVGQEGSLARDGEAVFVVAGALFDAGRAREAEALLDAARPVAAGADWLDLARARRALELDELERAVELASVADTSPPRARLADQPEAWLLLGRALERAGRDAEARPCLERGHELAPLGPGAYGALHALSQIALRANQGQRAQELVAAAAQVGQWRAYWRVRRLQVRERPDDPLPRLGLAQLWMQVGRHETALAELDALLERSPDYAPGWFHRGEVERARGHAAGARTSYDRALELDGELSLARFNRAVLALREGRTAEARADLERIVAGPQADDPKLLQAHLGLARILHAAGEVDAARVRHARYAELGGREALVP